MQKKKLLVIDDDQNFLEVVCHMISKMDNSFEPLREETARNGLKIACSEIPDLILLDWHLPDLDGIAVAQQLKQNTLTRHIPIILVSSSTYHNNGDLLPELGCSHFLSKPFQIREFKKAVELTMQTNEYINGWEYPTLTVNQDPLYLKKIINTIPHPIAVYNCDGICSYVNTGFIDKYMQQNMGRSINFYDVFNPTEALKQRKIDKEIFRNSQSFTEVEVTVRTDQDITSQGTSQGKHFLITKVPLIEATGEVVQIVSVIRDITSIKKDYTDTLESQKRELAFQNIRLLQVSDYNKNLLNEISSLSMYMNNEGKALLKEITAAHEFSEHETAWQEIENQFSLINDNFIKNLNRKHPDISPLERKLCFYLRLSMSTKQIALLTFSSEKSIEMARYRLRKKMNLPNGESLTTYLAGL